MTIEEIAEARDLLSAPDLAEGDIPQALLLYGQVVGGERDILLSRIGAADAEIALSRLDTLDTELATAKDEAKTLALSRAGTPVPSDPPEIALSRAETFSERLDVRVEKGKLTPHQAKIAKELVISAGAPNTFALSRDAGGQSIADKLLAFIDTLEGGVKAGEESGPQVIPLSREIAGQPKPEDRVNPWEATINQLAAGAK